MTPHKTLNKTPNFDAIPEQALTWFKEGKASALASVIKTWGSAPRPVGAMLAINTDFDMLGSVSGGCVEGAVVEEAIEAINTGQPRILEYGVSDEQAFAVGMACGGAIHILVEPVGVGDGISIEVLEQLIKRRRNRQAVAYLVNTKTWERKISGPECAEFDLSDRFISDKSGFLADTASNWFVNIHNPPLRLMIIGAVHIAQPLVQMAGLAGYDTVLIDPRDAFASGSRFPDQTLVKDWPDAALQAIGLDQRVAVVTLSHDPKLDDPAIHVALGSNVFYLGCLGSTRTHSKRVIRLQKAGFSPDQIKRIHAPIGADIGSKTPAEIAISIMAELTERLRRPETRP